VQSVKDIVIVGGGSAGWLIAGLLASEHAGAGDAGAVTVTLIESPDVPTIGVGEGTWPTMRSTLQKIGISESEFLVRCNASYKQGTRFNGWVSGQENDSYYHPFTLPSGYGAINLVPYWQEHRESVSFVDAVCAQGYLCDRNLAPKQASTPDYAFVANYGYHLDAGKFAELLREHCVKTLGVRHLSDHVSSISGTPEEDIKGVLTRHNGLVEGDLFIDCTGFAALLIGKHYQVPYVDRKDVLFNDSALAVQVPYASANSPIASQTISTARDTGWVWDIGLTERRGVGYTYSSAHSSDEEAERRLREYLRESGAPADYAAQPRKLSFRPGHRQRFWHRNCVAVGMSSGFIEPLEASALVMVELAGKAISEDLPADRSVMDVVARAYNEQFSYRWDRIIDFLKLHYVLSHRESPYWQDHRHRDSIPDSLREYLELWRTRPPRQSDLNRGDEIFSAASYQYVMCGMGFLSGNRKSRQHYADEQQAQTLFTQNSTRARQIVAGIPGNRELLAQISAQMQGAG
jgi:tryptophan halogenase